MQWECGVTWMFVILSITPTILATREMRCTDTRMHIAPQNLDTLMGRQLTPEWQTCGFESHYSRNASNLLNPCDDTIYILYIEYIMYDQTQLKCAVICIIFKYN